MYSPYEASYREKIDIETHKYKIGLNVLSLSRSFYCVLIVPFFHCVLFFSERIP